MRHYVSRDGTKIAVWSGGSGPPLLLVHGATADHSTTWRYVLGAFRRSFTVHAVDRRGRGGSGDSADYSLLREAQDVAAVVEGIGAPVNVVAHSYGALCALEATLLTSAIHRLVLYEGVPLDGAGLYDPAVIGRLEDRIAAGDREAALRTMYADLVGMDSDDVDQLRSQDDAWRTRLANVDTLARELRAEMGYRFLPERFAGVDARTLLLVGEHSPCVELRNAEGVAKALREAEVRVLPGQGHAAMYSAPALFAEVVLEYLSS